MDKTAQNKPAIDAALRHAVYRDLLDLLPPASYEQADMFAANLRLCGSFDTDMNSASIERRIDATMMRFINLRVTSENTTIYLRPDRLAEIEAILARRYGDRLADVPGFYRRNDRSAWRVNLPSNCAVYGYNAIDGPRPAFGFFGGILLQPLDQMNSYFLLSSAKFGGPKALPLLPRDQIYFTQFQEAA